MFQWLEQSKVLRTSIMSYRSALITPHCTPQGALLFLLDKMVVHHRVIPAFCHVSLMSGSRKYPYPYHGRHLGIPKGRGGYVDWNSEDMGGLRRLEFRGHGEGSLDWNSEGIRRFSGE